MKACDYVIISAANLDKLQDTVRNFILEHGAGSWLPAGGPVFQQDKSGNWHQAMYEVEIKGK